MERQKTILVLDDSPETKRLLEPCQSIDWQWDFVRDPTSGLQRLREKAYDILLTGVTTPGIRDVEVLRQLRTVRPHVKLILLTFESTPVSVIESIRAHAFSYFTGPFSQEALMEMISRAITEPAWDDGIDLLSARREWLTLRLKCRRVTAERLVQFVNELEAGLSPKDRADIATAFREMLLNAMEHGGKFDPEQSIDVSCIRTSQLVLFLIRDPGEGFSMNSLPHAAISNPSDSPSAHTLYRVEHGIRPGGFGILMAQGLVDELIYSEKGNEVILIKYIGEQSA